MPFTLTPDFRGFANRAISEAVGRPWEPLGRGPDSFDCWGFVFWVFGKAGVKLPDYPYAEGEKRDELFNTVLGCEDWDHVPQQTPYSIVTFGRGVSTSHVGIYHPNGLYYHCVSGRGVCGDRYNAIRHAFNHIDYWYPA